MKISDFWHFDFNHFNRPNWAINLWFDNFPYCTTCWLTKENKQTRKKNASFGQLKRLKWPVFFTEFLVKILKPSETSKNSSDGPKNPEIIQNLSIFDFTFWRDHRKTRFSATKGAISAKSTKSEKGVRLCYTACMGLSWKI